MNRRDNKISAYHNDRYWAIFLEQCAVYDSYRMAYEATEEIFRSETYKKPPAMSDQEWDDLRRYDSYESFRVGKWAQFGKKNVPENPNQLKLFQLD